MATNHYLLMKPIKLNFGYGDKLLEGYININLVKDRRGVKPDVNCDLRNPSVFESNYVDKMLYILVIKHLWKWRLNRFSKSGFEFKNPKVNLFSNSLI